jgi:hypothetical protein
MELLYRVRRGSDNSGAPRQHSSGSPLQRPAREMPEPGGIKMQRAHRRHAPAASAGRSLRMALLGLLVVISACAAPGTDAEGRGGIALNNPTDEASSTSSPTSTASPSPSSSPTPTSTATATPSPVGQPAATPAPANPPPVTPAPATPPPVTTPPPTPPAPVDPGPVAVDDYWSLTAIYNDYEWIDFEVFNNDYDSGGPTHPDGSQFYTVSVTSGTYGTVDATPVSCAGGTKFCLRYTATHYGPYTDYFSYTIVDAGGTTDSAIVTIVMPSR